MRIWYTPLISKTSNHCPRAWIIPFIHLFHIAAHLCDIFCSSQVYTNLNALKSMYLYVSVQQYACLPDLTRALRIKTTTVCHMIHLERIEYMCYAYGFCVIEWNHNVNEPQRLKTDIGKTKKCNLQTIENNILSLVGSFMDQKLPPKQKRKDHFF